jgi:prepilin-type processing-associated H-X9-DG protein
MAFALYAQDNDEVLPLAGRWNERSLAGWVFADGEWNVSVERGSLYPYVGNARVYRCGSEQNLAYTVNNVLAGRSLATVLDVVLLVEESEAAFGGRGPNDGVFYNDHEVDLLTKRHRGGGHVLWLDGHLRWIDATRRFDTTLFGGN